MKVVDRAFRSFFALLTKARKGDYRFQAVHLPHYRKKGALFNLILQANAISVNKNGLLNVPMSKALRIIPICSGRLFKIQYVYEVQAEDQQLNQSNALAIDIGLNNLAMCISTVGTSFIMDGRRIKSINRLWNKRRAELQSRLPKSQRTSIFIQRLTLKRNNRTNDCLKKTARYIINHCIANDIGTPVCGYNPDFKRGINLGMKTNPNFTQISFGNLREHLSNLCLEASGYIADCTAPRTAGSSTST